MTNRISFTSHQENPKSARFGLSRDFKGSLPLPTLFIHKRRQDYPVGSVSFSFQMGLPKVAKNFQIDCLDGHF